MTARGVWQILRLPLFLTAAADSAAGYMVACLQQEIAPDWTRLGLAAGASTALYLFGMVENDLVDIRRDRLLKVPRPLVTGRIGVAGAIVLLILTAGLAVVCVGQLRGGAIVLAALAFAAVNLYNLSAKRGPFYVAMPTMGLCRVFSFGIGVTAAIGVPRPIEISLLLPTGPLWAHQAVALFFATMIVTGYSISARDRYVVSTRPWQAMFVAATAAGFAMIAYSTMARQPAEGEMRFVAPVARTLAAMLLPVLWPGGLWSSARPKRKPEEYGVFIERTLYWYIVMDVAFVLDALLI
jgi:4-hydroxybenzoate polyprenyltransferase